ncbi:MAG TPA: hypothetical protein VLK58_28610 [Conexibacter sp.]|nr:hypothetical protein [Conexibacter sp.]
MPLTTSTLRRLLLLLVCAAVAASFVAPTGGSTAQSKDAPAAPPQASPAYPFEQPSAAVVAAREAEFEEQFALLREPGGETIPASTHISDAALDVGASRQLTPPPASRLAGEGVEQPESMVFVTPRADGSQCLLSVEPGTHGPHQTCAYADQAVDGYFVMTATGLDGATEIYGLLPDGVDEVAVELADGTSVTLPVISNGYMARFDQPTATITWTDGDDVERSLMAGVGN